MKARAEDRENRLTTAEGRVRHARLREEETKRARFGGEEGGEEGGEGGEGGFADHDSTEGGGGGGGGGGGSRVLETKSGHSGHMPPPSGLSTVELAPLHRAGEGQGQGQGGGAGGEEGEGLWGTRGVNGKIIAPVGFTTENTKVLVHLIYGFIW
jgi:hypothetical protein